MDIPPPASVVTPPVSDTNPHVLWRQLLGLVLWITIFSLPAGGPIGALLALALGGVTFADAWTAGIYKHPAKKSFLNISPMGWGVTVALLFVVAYPTYLLNRDKLKTMEGRKDLYWAVVLLGAIVILLIVLGVLGALASKAK
jgi:hypothetical protein